MRRRMTWSGATSDFPTSISDFGTARTPRQVLMQTGKIDIRQTTAAFTVKPRPSHSTNSGTKAHRGKIGRASCRERVRQNGEDQEVAVTLKKKRPKEPRTKE